jgi:hypothetical protein
MSTKQVMWVWAIARTALVAAIAIVLISPVGLRAQEVTGKILGTVVDTTGGAVPNAQITITNQDTGVVRTTVSGSDGLYNVPEVQAGTYSITTMAQGFSPLEVKDILVAVATDTRVDLKLTVGQISQGITVTEAAPVVDTTSSTVGALVNEQSVEDLPLNGRNWTDLTLMEPGISQTKTFSNVNGMTGTVYSSNGAGGRSNTYLLDGALENTVFGMNNSSIIGTSLGVDGIKEYKVVTNVPDAEYGLTGGSQSTIVSKGGTNQFHGDVFDYLRNSSMDARNYFDALDSTNALGYGSDKSSVYPGKRIPPYRRNDFGGSVGGPIRKDKTFFYAVFEGLRQQLGVTIATQTLPAACFDPTTHLPLTMIPSAACALGAPTSTVYPFAEDPVVAPLQAVFPYPNVAGQATFNYSFPFIQPATEEYGQIRLDQTFSAKDSFYGRYTQDNSDETQNNPYPQAQQLLHGAAQFATLSEDHILSPTLLNTLRFSFSRTDYILTSALTGPKVNGTTAPFITDTLYNGAPNDPTSIGPGSGVTAWTTNNGPSPFPGNIQNVLTTSDDLFWTKGKHSLKFGFLWDRFDLNMLILFQQGGSVAFPSIYSMFIGQYSSVSWTPQSNSDQAHAFIFNTFGSYVQDDYRVLPRLTLNLGLRYEPSTVPHTCCGEPYYSVRAETIPGLAAPFGTLGPPWVNASLHNFSPRVGFAWDVTGKGKTALRGGVGMYYDVGIIGALLINTLIETPPLSENITIPNSLTTPAVALSIPLDPMQAKAAISPLVMRSIPYHDGQPTSAQWNLTLDQQLPWDIGMTIGYVGSRGWHLYRQQEGNPIIPLGTGTNGLPIYCLVPASTCPVDSNRVNNSMGESGDTGTFSESWFDALQFVVTKRLTHGLQFVSSYTWSRNLDNGVGQLSTDGSSADMVPGNPENIDKGPSTYNVPQNWRVNLIYHIPDMKSDKLYAKPLQGWWVSGISTWQLGQPVNLGLGIQRSLQTDTGATDRPNLDPSFNYGTLITGNPNQWFNTTMFDMPAQGTFGNAPRGLITGPGTKNVDFSINKDTKLHYLGEQGRVQFQAQFFNILNHPNFGPPNATLFSSAGGAASFPVGQIGVSSTLPANPKAGAITTTSNNSRQIQLGLKILF